MHVGEVGLAADLALLRRNSNTWKMRFLPRAGGMRPMQLVGERDDRDAVEVGEADVGQRGADLHRVVRAWAGAPIAIEREQSTRK